MNIRGFYNETEKDGKKGVMMILFLCFCYSAIWKLELDLDHQKEHLQYKMNESFVLETGNDLFWTSGCSFVHNDDDVCNI